MNPKISVIVPVYNTGSILKKTLKHVQNQSFQNFECLLINDGSSNLQTIRICKEFSDRDKRFILFNKKNEGIEKTRLYGVAKASSDLLVFCDHDDFYELNAIEILHNAYLASKADIVVANCWHQRFFRSQLGRKIIEPALSDEALLDQDTFIKKWFVNFFGINRFPVSTWGKLYRKHLFTDDLQSFDVNFMEDIVINLQIFNNAKKVHFITNSIYTHIYGGLSSNFNYEKIIDGYDKVYLFRKKYLLDNHIDFKPLLIEYKNVVNQAIDLLIDNGLDIADFRSKINLLFSKVIFTEVLNYLTTNERGEYINLLKNNEVDLVYVKAKSKHGLKRKVKHIVKNIVKKL